MNNVGYIFSKILHHFFEQIFFFLLHIVFSCVILKSNICFILIKDGLNDEHTEKHVFDGKTCDFD